MATTATPKKRTTAKPAAKRTTTKKPRTAPGTKAKTAAARSTTARKGAVTRGINRTDAAADSVRKDAEKLQADYETAIDAAVSTGRSAAMLAGNYAERVAYVQVGAVLTARDTVTETIEDLRTKVTDRESAEKEIRRLEKRGEVARVRAQREVKKARTRVERELRRRRNTIERDVKRNRTRVEREVRSLRKDAEKQVRDLRTQVTDVQVPDVVTPVREAVKPVVDRFAA
jgi:hypothetical protein